MNLSKKEWTYTYIEILIIFSTFVYALFAHQFSKKLRNVNLGDPNLSANIEYNWKVIGYTDHLRDVIIAISVIIIFTVITYISLRKFPMDLVIILFNILYLIFYLIFLWDPIIATFVFMAIAGIGITSSILNIND